MTTNFNFTTNSPSYVYQSQWGTVGIDASQPYWVNALAGDWKLEMASFKVSPAHVIGVSFPQKIPQTDPYLQFAASFKAFDANAQNKTWEILRKIETVIDVQFVPSSNPTDTNTISFIQSSLGGNTTGLAYSLYPGYFSGVVVIDTDLNIPTSHVSGISLVHEIGHALGLKHPFEGAIQLKAAEDNTSNTVESYTPDPLYWTNYVVDFQNLDVAALQYLYGPSKTARTGNDTYTLVENNPNFIWDGVGNDTVDGSALSAALTLDLNPGAWGFIGAKKDLITAPGQVTVNQGSVIENVLGSRFDDSLNGNSADNRLEGNAGNDSFWPGAGNDVVVGGSGIDAVVLNGPRSSYTVNAFDPATGSVTLTSATDGRKDISSVERVLFNNGTEGVALDLHNGGTAGEVAKIIGAVLPHHSNTKALAGEGLRLLDSGMPREKVGELALNLALGANSTNTDVVNLLWTNLFGKAPSPSEATPFVQALDAGYFTRGSLTGFAADLLDQKVGLTGVGYLEYTPFVG